MNTFRRYALPISLFTLVLVATVSAGCRGKHSTNSVQNEEPAAAPKVLSSLKMSDPSAAQQLVKGFYGLEGGSWRWTAREFTAMLKTPVAAAQRGAALTFSFTIPDVVIQKLSKVTLTASVGGTKLKSETYSKPGSYTLTADIPGDQLGKDTVLVDFALDKSMPAGSADTRDLGIIATGVGLETK